MTLRQHITAFLYRKQRAEYYWSVRQKAINGRGLSQRWNRYIHLDLMNRNNADIPLETQIDSLPTFPHGLTGIFISCGAKIGKNCVIFHQVTIGSNTLPDSRGKGSPVIGDNVYIGCGAKIIGNVRIGNNVRIGANCVVTQDIPDNATVVLEKPRIIVHSEPKDNRFIVYSN